MTGEGRAGRWRRLRRLTALEWRLLADAWLLSVVVTVALRCVPFSRVVTRLDRHATAPDSRPPVSPARLAVLVESAAARVPGATCLTRALVLHTLLHRLGVETELVITTKREGVGLAAHALVRRGTEVLLGGGRDDYVPLWSRRIASS